MHRPPLSSASLLNQLVMARENPAPCFPPEALLWQDRVGRLTGHRAEHLGQGALGWPRRAKESTWAPERGRYPGETAPVSTHGVEAVPGGQVLGRCLCRQRTASSSSVFSEHQQAGPGGDLFPGENSCEHLRVQRSSCLPRPFSAQPPEGALPRLPHNYFTRGYLQLDPHLLPALVWEDSGDPKRTPAAQGGGQQA